VVRCLAVGLLLSVPLPVAAQPHDADRLAAQLDRPVATKKVPAKSDDDPDGQIKCTYYRDFMLRETGTDTPDPNDAKLFPVAAGAARPNCDASQRDDAVSLKTEGYSYIGRKGRFLLFSATDPNGAVPFTVLDADSGKAIFADGTPADRGIQVVALDHDTLHLGYTRAFNAPCSLLKDLAACWSSLVADGTVPRGMAQPPRDLCAASYKEESAPADDPSIVSYDVDTTIDAQGQAHVVAHSAIGCAPVP
jgi:hypothetical protein